MKIRGIEEHFPKMLTPTQKSLVDRKLTLAALQNGWSYSSLQRPSVGRFLTALRPGYTVPSIYMFGKERMNLFNDVQVQVDRRLRDASAVTLAFDGWRNHLGTQTIAVAAITPSHAIAQNAICNLHYTNGQWHAIDQGTYILAMKDTERETSEVWTEELAVVAGRVQAMGVQVIATIADNASNAQRVVQNSPGLNLNCLAHVANLLMKDASKSFEKQFDQCKEVQALFKNRSRARKIYAQGPPCIFPAGRALWKTRRRLA